MTQENVQKTFQKRSEILVGITSHDTRMARVLLEILFAGVIQLVVVFFFSRLFFFNNLNYPISLRSLLLRRDSSLAQRHVWVRGSLLGVSRGYQRSPLGVSTRGRVWAIIGSYQQGTAPCRNAGEIRNPGVPRRSDK